MKAIATIAALSSSFFTTASAEYFGLLSLRSASPIHYQSVSASDHSLWLNKPTGSFCPDNVKKIGGCPVGNTTDFTSADGTLSMGTVVPGGQQVYIEPETGAVKYTTAHSAAVPEGAIVTGWHRSEEGSLGYLKNEKGGFVACPASGNDKDSWKVFIALECVDFADACLSFDALASNLTEASAWQYT